MNSHSRSNWVGPGLLLLLGSLNILSGAMQLDKLWLGPPDSPDEFTAMHYFASPIPIVFHIIAGTIWNLFGPLQFVPKIRRKWPKFHRYSGRFLVLSGFIVGITGLWMNHFFPAYGGPAKYISIVVHSIGIMVSLSIALQAIFKRDIKRHELWMMRAVAIGLSPATQRVFILPIYFITGDVSDLVIGVGMWSAFVVNLGFVEWARRRKKVHFGLG